MSHQRSIVDVLSDDGSSVFRSLVSHLDPFAAGEVLDYGDDPQAPHVRALLELGYKVTVRGAEDVGPFNVVLAANATADIIRELKQSASSASLVLLQFVDSLDVSRIEYELTRLWRRVSYDRPGGTTKVFWCWSKP